MRVSACLVAALLISGNAASEEKVYYCNTVEFTQVTLKKGVADIKSYPFKMLADASKRLVKFKGEVQDGVELENVTFGDNKESFYNADEFGLYNFSESYLVYAGFAIAIDERLIFSPEGFIAKCDAF